MFFDLRGTVKQRCIINQKYNVKMHVHGNKVYKYPPKCKGTLDSQL